MGIVQAVVTVNQCGGTFLCLDGLAMFTAGDN